MKKAAWFAGVLLVPFLCASEGWQPVGPYGGSATAVAVDPSRPDTLLLGARNSLIYRSDDQGQSWRRLPFPRHFLGTVSALAIDPSDSNRYFAAVSAEHSPYGGVWRSVDGGTTWTLSQDIAGMSAEALAVSPRNPRVLVAGTRQGVWRTTDGGEKWERISRPYNHEMRVITAVAIDPLSSDVIYAGTPHLPWKTADGGKTWDSIHQGMIDDSDVFSIFIDPERPESVLASACSGIYRSDSKGDRWSKFAGIPASHRRTHVIRLHPENRSVIYAGTTLGLLKSTNGGATFRQVNNLHILSMVFDPREPKRIFLATEGTGLWKSEDGGETVEPLNHGFVNRKVLEITSAGDRLFANAVQDGAGGGIYSSGDGGKTWSIAASTRVLGDNHIHHVAGHPADEKIVFAANERKLLRSVDGGRNWKALVLPGKGGPARISSLKTMMGKGFVVLIGTDQGLFRSGDLGATWSAVPLAKVTMTQAVLGLTVSAPRLIVRTTSTLYLSEDSGANWRPLSLLLPTSLVYDIALPSGLSEPILLATAKGLYRSEDGGKTWFRKDQGLQDGTVSSVRYHSGGGGQVWAVQFGRLYRSDDYGRNWRAVGGGYIPESTIRALWTDERQPDRLFALTPDLGMYFLETKDFRLHNMEKAGTP